MNRKQRRAAKSQGNATTGLRASAGPTDSRGQVATQFAAAFSHHQAGRLAEAETLYRQIWAVDSNQVGSLHFLGVIAPQAGRTAAAIDLIDRPWPSSRIIPTRTSTSPTSSR